MNKEYIAAEYRRIHESGRFSGESLKPHEPEIRKLIAENDISTILDYGCGKANWHKKFNLVKDLTLYDPYYGPYSQKPSGKFDMVICTDVLEHVPEDDVESVLSELIDYTEKVLFLAIAIRPAHKSFSNGINLHLTVWPKDKWEELIDRLTCKNIKIIRHYL